MVANNKISAAAALDVRACRACWFDLMIDE